MNTSTYFCHLAEILGGFLTFGGKLPTKRYLDATLLWYNAEVNYGELQPGLLLSFEPELSLVVVLFQSADQIFGTVSLLI